MVGMIVAENDVFDIFTKIDAQLFGVFQHGVRSRARVEQNPLPVNFDDGGKPHSPMPLFGLPESMVESALTRSDRTVL